MADAARGRDGDRGANWRCAVRAVLVFLGMVIGTVSVSLATGDWEGDALRLISYAAAIATYEAVIALEKLLDKDEQ